MMALIQTILGLKGLAGTNRKESAVMTNQVPFRSPTEIAVMTKHAPF